MARKKIENTSVQEHISDELDDIIEETGGQRLSDTSKVGYFIDTGNLALNWMTSGKFVKGGFPAGKIIEILGPPATAKSLLGLCILASCQRMGGYAILLDCERAGNADFAKAAARVDTTRLITYEPDNISEVERKVLAVVKKIREKRGIEVPICILWDSIAVTPTEREWNTTKLSENFTDKEFKDKVGSQEKPGERARAAGDFLRRMNPFLNNNNATLIIINQIRNKIGVLYGSPDTRAQGGQALEYYVSCVYRTTAKKQIEDSTGLPLGVNLKFKNEKCRTHVPKLSTEGVQLFFDSGISPIGGLLSVLQQAKRIECSKPGMYKVLEPYAEGKELTFRSSKERNDVPLEILTDCPSLIDLNTKDEVMSYFSAFKDALALATGGSIVEIDIKDEDQEKPRDEA